MTVSINTNLLVILKCARIICDQMKLKLILYLHGVSENKLSLPHDAIITFPPILNFMLHTGFTQWSHDFKFRPYFFFYRLTNYYASPVLAEKKNYACRNLMLFNFSTEAELLIPPLFCPENWYYAPFTPILRAESAP